MIFDVINSLGRIMLTFLVIYKTTQYRDQMIPAERLGLGMMGGASFLTVSVIWQGARSPFDGWAVSILTFGTIIFLSGRLIRNRRHWRRNEDTKEQARGHLAARGKL